MKTKEKLAMIKTEHEDVNDKLKELTDEELEEVTGGADPYIEPTISDDAHESNERSYERF